MPHSQTRGLLSPQETVACIVHDNERMMHLRETLEVDVARLREVVQSRVVGMEAGGALLQKEQRLIEDLRQHLHIHLDQLKQGPLQGFLCAGDPKGSRCVSRGCHITCCAFSFLRGHWPESHPTPQHQSAATPTHTTDPSIRSPSRDWAKI